MNTVVSFLPYLGVVLLLAATAQPAAPNAFGAEPANQGCPIGGYSVISCPVVNDQVIADAVKLRLSGSVINGRSRVSISVTGGVVTLSGGVESQGKRDLASILAGSVRGVARVNNQLCLCFAEAGDVEIVAAVRKALSRALFPTKGVMVESSQGVVRLTGMIGNEWYREQAGTIAAGVPGVTAVHNNLIAKSPEDNVF